MMDTGYQSLNYQRHRKHLERPKRDDGPSPMSNMKMFGIFAIIAGCFVILTPKIFWPMFRQLFFGPTKRSDDDQPTFSHPRERAARPQMDPRVHPSMHMAEANRQSSPQAGRGGGAMSMILPIYAVGIVVYLLYTLTKVFGRKKDDDNGDEYGSSLDYASYKRRFMNQRGVPYQNSGRGTMRNSRLRPSAHGSTHHDPNLISQLNHEKDELHSLEMAALQSRLIQTEKQIAQILKALTLTQKRTEKIGKAIVVDDSENGSTDAELSDMSEIDADDMERPFDQQETVQTSARSAGKKRETIQEVPNEPNEQATENPSSKKKRKNRRNRKKKAAAETMDAADDERESSSDDKTGHSVPSLDASEPTEQDQLAPTQAVVNGDKTAEKEAKPAGNVRRRRRRPKKPDVE